MKYFKADIHYMSELYINNNLNEGCDPNTFSDSGICETIRATTLEKLHKELIYRFEEIEYFEENRYDAGYDSIERDGTHVYNMISIYVYEVIENETILPTRELLCEA